MPYKQYNEYLVHLYVRTIYYQLVNGVADEITPIRGCAVTFVNTSPTQRHHQHACGLTHNNNNNILKLRYYPGPIGNVCVVVCAHTSLDPS